jgi:hypothetical protein
MCFSKQFGPMSTRMHQNKNASYLLQKLKLIWVISSANGGGLVDFSKTSWAFYVHVGDS